MTSHLHLGATPWRGLDPEEVAPQAARAEELGLDSFWLPESHFLKRGSVPSPLLLLAAAAVVTERLQLGTVSLLLPIRDPVLLAEEVAVLDNLAAGRLILGVGRGFRRELFETFGVPVGEKRSLFEAALGRMQAAWAGEPLLPGSVGDEEDRSSPRLSPLPVQRPGPAIWVAAFGPRALAQSARLGLPYLASPLEPLSQLEDNFRRYAQERGAMPDIVPVMRTVFLSEDEGELAAVREGLRAEASAIARSRSGRLRQAAEADLDERVLVGDAQVVARGVQRYRERLGMTHLIARSPLGLAAESCERSLSQLREVV